MINQDFLFHGTKMKISAGTKGCDNAYCVMEMHHQPLIGPALHTHPRGNETFYILQGTYTFNMNGSTIELEVGELLTVPKNTPHSYKSGTSGGKLLIVMPPGLENYFWEVAQIQLQKEIPLQEEFLKAEKYGQIFLDNSSHW